MERSHLFNSNQHPQGWGVMKNLRLIQEPEAQQVHAFIGNIVGSLLLYNIILS